MVEVEHGEPVYLTTFNAGAADTIGTDELWATNRMRIPGLSGLNLNGEDTQLALWGGGAALTTHREFAMTNNLGIVSSRVSDGDGSSINGFGGHATHVAGTLVAAGVDARAKDMSPKAMLLSHDFYSDFTEMTAAFANTNNYFRVSNHSYSQHTG